MVTFNRSLRAAALILGALALGACSVSTGDDGDADDTGDASGTNTGEAVTIDAPTHGVTDDSLRVGVAPIDADAVRDTFGVELGGVPADALPALADAVNADGGIHGRRIELVSRPFMPIGTEESEAACRELTEDEQVFAVAGMFLGDNALCVTETYETPYIGLWGLSEERRERSVAPFLTMEDGQGDRLARSIDRAVADGLLEDRSVAVYHEGDLTPDEIQRHAVDRLESAGIEVASTGQLPSSGDAVQAAADIDLLFERFQADGADALVVAAGAGVVLPALERTSWEPDLVFANGQVLGDSALADYGLTEPAELEGAHAVIPGLTTDEMADDPALQTCLDTINAHSDLGLTPDDIYSTEQNPDSRGDTMLPALCQLWQLTVDLLTAAGEDPSPQSLVDGLAGLDDVDLAGYPDLSFEPDRWGAMQVTRSWSYDADAVRFVPDGPLSTVEGP